MADAESKRLGSGSAADLLSRWRAAERDSVAALDAAETATLAAAAAETASRAAMETAESAKLALQAATRAEQSARETADAAKLLAATTRRAQTDAERVAGEAGEAEQDAKDRFHDAQKAGFPRNEGAEP